MHEPPAVGDPVAPLPPRLARLAELDARGAAATADPYARGFPRADELPEVQALIHDGWQPLDDAPLYSLLPGRARRWAGDDDPSINTD
jgi:hypothetical protein